MQNQNDGQTTRNVNNDQISDNEKLRRWKQYLQTDKGQQQVLKEIPGGGL